MSRIPELEQQLVAAAQARAAGGRKLGWSASPRRPRRGLARVVLPVGAVAATVAVAVALVGGGSQTVATAAAALREAADVARSQPAVTPPTDGYVYVRTSNVPSLAFPPGPPFGRDIDSPADYGFSVELPTIQEVWQGAEGGRQRLTTGKATFPTERDRRAWVAAGRPELPPAGVMVDRLGALEPLDLPVDPDALYARLYDEAADRGAGRHAYMFTLVGDALAELRATPEQRAALFEVAARIPGVEVLGERTDPAGRKGVAFAMRDEFDPYRRTLIVDPDTAQLLAQTQVTLPGNAIPAGTVTSTQTYDAPRAVDAIGSRRP